jgi:hypothetical protein
VYHSATPLFGSQTLNVKILDSDNSFNVIFQGELPLSPYSTLTWFGFSEGNINIYK